LFIFWLINVGSPIEIVWHLVLLCLQSWQFYLSGNALISISVISVRHAQLPDRQEIIRSCFNT